MDFLSEQVTIEELDNRQLRQTVHLKPIAVRENGTLLAIDATFVASGDAALPHLVQRAPLRVRVADDGMRRLYPVRDDDSKYLEVGSPFVKVGGTWTQVSLGTPTRSAGLITWTRPQTITRIQHGGYFVKLDIELRNGFVPEDSQVAFPVGLVGLTRQGTRILQDGVEVMKLRKLIVEDVDDPAETRPIDHQFVNLSGQPYLLLTLPDLTGMSRPRIDPTFSVQPDGAAGKDTFIIDASPTQNNGVSNFQVGERNDGSGVMRGLMQFDLSTIPAAATVSSSTLTLTLWLDRTSNIRTLRVYRMLRSWVEGDNTAGSGATWNTYNGTNNWGTSGAANTTSDREATDIGSLSMPVSPTPGAAYAWSLTAVRVQDWISGAVANNGFMLKADTELNDGNYFYSSDHSVAGERPVFEVVYTAPSVTRHFMQYQRARQ